MHMLPEPLFDVFRSVSREATKFGYPMPTVQHQQDGRRLRAEFWRALKDGDKEAVLQLLIQGTDPNGKSMKGETALATLGAFAKLDAALVTMYLVAYGATVDTADADLMDRIDLALIVMGHDCGGANSEATVGMHMLPPELYPLYRAAVERARQADPLENLAASPNAAGKRPGRSTARHRHASRNKRPPKKNAGSR